MTATTTTQLAHSTDTLGRLKLNGHANATANANGNGHASTSNGHTTRKVHEPVEEDGPKLVDPFNYVVGLSSLALPGQP